MKKITPILLILLLSYSVSAQEAKDITYDYFKTNSQSYPLKDITPKGEQMTVYMDMIKDWKKNDMQYVMRQINKGLDLFKDSLQDAARTHVLEIAITPNQTNTFFRYKSQPNPATDIMLIKDEIVNVKHRVDTIRVYEHFQKVYDEDTIIYKIVYEILAKDLSTSDAENLTSSISEVTEKSFKRKKTVYNITKTLTRFGFYWGVGFTATNQFPIGYQNDMGVVFATGRTHNGYTPFIGYNMKNSLTYIDEKFKGAEFHLFEWGIMKSTKLPYHLVYNKYSMGIGIMRVANTDNWNNLYSGNKYIVGMAINFPIINNLGASINVGNNFSKSNPQTYAAISFKAHLSLIGIQ